MKTRINPALMYAIAFMLIGATSTMAIQAGDGRNVPPARAKGPCDIYAAAGQVSMFLNDIPGFSSLAMPFQSILRISTISTAGISMIGLHGRFNERGDFLMAAMPSVNEDAPKANGESFFPHIASGDSYTTQFFCASVLPWLRLRQY
jgi:hypothetical protein